MELLSAPVDFGGCGCADAEPEESEGRSVVPSDESDAGVCGDVYYFDPTNGGDCEQAVVLRAGIYEGQL
eukprot:CAMPEP_0194445270 /NCGR_PEP_ID=MMETSP0176-20130528/127757_1 /TAXON_ID=216777 /ORGANISM="Proboscia alata, Strain PI-D3" /LENGTH=68 /DNA_ID=CAMNT_0039271795 /DNA_START=614 /DNA_END=820 /DNA_ORIENTATION=+